MINLIPNEEKKRMRTEFYFRLIVMFFVVMGFSVFVSVIPLVPSYVFSITENKSAEARLLSQQKSTPLEPSEDTVFLIQNINQKIKTISDIRNKKVFVSQYIIDQLVQNKPSEIKINQITYTSSSGEYLVSIRGVAPSRDGLLSFKQYLEKNPSFKEVDLPISNFIKGSNIQFDIKLKPVI